MNNKQIQTHKQIKVYDSYLSVVKDDKYFYCSDENPFTTTDPKWGDYYHAYLVPNTIENYESMKGVADKYGGKIKVIVIE